MIVIKVNRFCLSVFNTYIGELSPTNWPIAAVFVGVVGVSFNDCSVTMTEKLKQTILNRY